MNHFLDQNCERWAKNCPKQALLLPYLQDEGVHEVITSGFDNLSIQTQEKSFLLHSEQNPEAEAKKWFEALNLKDEKALFIYGVGLGFGYLALEKWLSEDKKRKAVFLEDNLQVIKKLLSKEIGEKILKDPQVELLYFKDLSDNEEQFENLYWEFAQSKFTVSSLPSYEAHKLERFSEVRHKIAYDAAVKNALLDEYVRFGGAFFINFYQNMLCLPDSYLGNRFFGQFKGVPAIICGAGPSLVKQLPLLNRYKENALIFAGGSAMNVLNSADIQPHFGAGIDPNPMQLERLSANTAYEVPYFYRNRMFHGAFNAIRGPRLYITGCGGYDVADWFEKELGIEEEFIDEGHNVVNFCIEVASRLGCNPIILLGCDLAFTDMKAYAPGVVDDAGVDKKSLVEGSDYDELALLRQDIYGNPVYTLWKWIAESEWISNFAKEHPFITLINSTEGGIGFSGIRNIPIEEVAKSYFKEQSDLLSRVHRQTMAAQMPTVTQEKVDALALKLKESCNRSIEHLVTLHEEGQKMIERIQREKKVPEIAQSGLAALAETELSEEVAYGAILEIFNAVFTRKSSDSVRELKSDESPEARIELLKLNQQKLVFLKKVVEVNASLIDYAFKEKLAPPRKLDKEIEVKEGTFETPQVTPGAELVSRYGSNGELLCQELLTSNKLNGPSYHYNEKGALAAASFFKAGKREGETFWYYPDGSKYAVLHYQSGLLEGKQQYFDIKGELLLELEYNFGKLIRIEKRQS